ncbi:hypothetical protein CDAR_380431 [Caerostris darwini]|uniref:Uncharacterized protein n=1 Tax=Caerostris darwini TaxID=1538125 RepID=A0AAV4TMI7_9ARAC|nr:hypothetical protein CDAR_380431 [Caerostris darwini]
MSVELKPEIIPKTIRCLRAPWLNTDSETQREEWPMRPNYKSSDDDRAKVNIKKRRGGFPGDIYRPLGPSFGFSASPPLLRPLMMDAGF